MLGLRRLFDELRTIFAEDPTKAEWSFRRLVLPSGRGARLVGELFGIAQGEELPLQIGEMPQQRAVLRWLRKKGAATFIDDRLIEADIAATLSLAAHRRVRVLSEVPISMEGNRDRITFLPGGVQVDSELTAPVTTESLATVGTVLWGALAIAKKEQFEAVARSVRLYHAAILSIGREDSAAYSLLVAALEALADEFEPAPTSFDEWTEAEAWNGFMRREEFSNEQAEALRARLMQDRHMNLSRRFVSYAVRMVPATFWTETWHSYAPHVEMPAGVLRGWMEAERDASERIRRSSVLAANLRTVYQARSRYFHAGEPFPAGDILGLNEFPLSTDEQTGPLSEIPSLEFFERLTRAVILATIDRAGKHPDFSVPDWRIEGDEIAPVVPGEEDAPRVAIRLGRRERREAERQARRAK